MATTGKVGPVVVYLMSGGKGPMSDARLGRGRGGGCRQTYGNITFSQLRCTRRSKFWLMAHEI